MKTEETRIAMAGVFRIFAGGHLHLEGGQSVEIDGTTFINAAICDDSYTPLRKPIEIDLTAPEPDGEQR